MSSPPSSPAPHHSPPPAGVSAQGTDLFRHLESYPWSADAAFQSGLVAILGPSQNSLATDVQLNDLALHARCFYYARKFGITVDHQAYMMWRRSQPEDALSSLNANARMTLEERAPSTLSQLSHMSDAGDSFSSRANDFSDGISGEPSLAMPPAHHAAANGQPEPADFRTIVELIQTGAPISGIREIPQTVLEGQGTESVTPQRRKPWELTQS